MNKPQSSSFASESDLIGLTPANKMHADEVDTGVSLVGRLLCEAFSAEVIRARISATKP
jgi:hypothetical protein